MKNGAERGQGGSMLGVGGAVGVVLRSYEIGYGSEYLFLNQKSAAN